MPRPLFDRGARGAAIEEIQTALGFAERDGYELLDKDLS